jgi:hypothetical protein
VPVELTERALHDVIAVMGEWNRDGAQAAESALNWMGWEGEGPLLLRRYDVQLFAWYTLPRKFLTSLEHKREATAALAQTLERLGGRAAGYAEVCRSAETDELLRAWQAEDPNARRRLRELLDRSGIEPPDTELLSWGHVMGFAEASIREQVSTALEQAIEDGRLTPVASSFRRRQAQIVDATLLEPEDEDDGRTRLQVIHAERLERWVRHGNTRGSHERRASIAPVAGLLASEPPTVDPAAAHVAMEPALWLLEQATNGITLTQTGALNRALVREVAQGWPSWWNAELFGPPKRQDDLGLLCELDALLRELRLVRPTKRQVVITAKGRTLLTDPPQLLITLTTALLAGDSFRAACAELAAALILDGTIASYSGALAERIHPAIVAEGWQAAGEPPHLQDVRWTISDFQRPAEAIGILERRESGSRLKPDPLILTPVGRVALIAALRARALATATGPY